MDNKLFMHFENNGALSNLTDEQISKFKFACKKAVVDNPKLDFNDLCIACRIYLNFIISFPDLNLGSLRDEYNPLE